MTPEETLKALEKRLPDIMKSSVVRELKIYLEMEEMPRLRKMVKEADEKAVACRTEVEQLKTLLIEFMARKSK